MTAVIGEFDTVQRWPSKQGWHDGQLLGAVPRHMAERAPASLLLSQMEQELSELRAHTVRELEQKVLFHCCATGRSLYCT